MPKIKLNFWGGDDKKDEKKEEKKPPLKNEVLIRIFKRVKDHQKVVFGEGSGNYGRFFQLDNQIVWSTKINNMPLELKGEKATDPYTLPSSSALSEITELIESNNTKDADEKLTNLYESEEKDKA